MHLNRLVDRLPDSFNNATNVTKSHTHVANACACLEKLFKPHPWREVVVEIFNLAIVVPK